MIDELDSTLTRDISGELCACSRWESGLLRFPRRGSLFPRVLCVTGIDRHQESSQAWRLRSGRAVGVLGLPCILPPVLKLSPATAIFHVTRNSDSDRELQTEEMAFPPFIIRLEKERSTVNGTSSTRRPTVSACRLPLPGDRAERIRSYPWPRQLAEPVLRWVWVLAETSHRAMLVPDETGCVLGSSDISHHKWPDQIY